MENLKGMMAAAEVLMDRLKHKDYKKWTEVVAFAPPQLVGAKASADNEQIALGTTIKQLLQKELVTIKFNKDGVACATLTKKGRSIKSCTG